MCVVVLEKQKIHHMKNSDENKVEIDFRDIDAIEPIGLISYNPSEYKNLTRSSYWFVYDNIKKIASVSKLGLTIYPEDKIRKQSEEMLSKYNNHSYSDLVALHKYFASRARQAEIAIDKMLPLFVHLFSNKSQKIDTYVEVKSQRVYSIGGWLTFTRIRLFVNAVNRENLCIKLVQGLTRIIDRNTLGEKLIKVKASSKRVLGRVAIRNLYDEYRPFYEQKYQEKKRQTEEYGARKYAAEETVKVIWKEKKINIKIRNVLDAMRRR